MEIFGLEKLSLVDFDGLVASTVFTGTCNFRCGFCHNALLVLDSKNLPIVPEEDVLEYLNSKKKILDGVCVSGGEPTLQKDLPLFLEKLRKTGLKIKLDTNGTNPQIVKTLVENNLVDYFAVDVKNDRDNYAKIIGFDKYDTSCVEKTVEYLITNDLDYEFRTTLIDEYHKEDNVKKIGEWIKGAKKYFMQKFKPGDNCISGGLTEVKEEKAKEYLNIVSPFVKKASLRGY